MNFSSPTRRKEFRRCRKRFYYRYLYRPVLAHDLKEHNERFQLCGIRELAGNFIHRTLARMVKSIAAGSQSWNQEAEGKECVRQFLEVVAKSLCVGPGVLIGDLQLAETFNGASPVDLKDDINHWRVLIPTAIENAFRAAHELHLHHETSVYKVQTEQEVFWTYCGNPLHFVFDVVTQSPYQTIIIDWKTHEIDNDDVFQVRAYLDYFHKALGVSSSKLFGFAVDLRKGEITKITYDPYRQIGRPTRGPSTASIRTATPGPKHPTNPSPELCLRCPYASMCSDALLPAFCTSMI
jgi:CRISPR/Cas system-associated exonuclease Cas4 (RecB family)